MQAETKNCQNCKNDFIIEPDDFGFYEKIKVPPPTFCPECRSQRRLAYRNDIVFYNRECDLCKRKIISLYSTDNPQIIYCNHCWWSDKWDPTAYAQDFDFSRNFFEQYREFRLRVPAIAMMNDDGIASENCEYTQDFAFGKNCYMTMVSWKMQDCMYLMYGADAKNCVDCMGILGMGEALYECMYSDQCFACKYVYNSSGMIDSYFCYDCSGCKNCFQCVGLRNQKYCFRNEKYTEEEYRKIIKSYNLNTYTGIKKAEDEFNNFLLKIPRRFSHFRNCVNCIGENLSNSKNSKNVFHNRGSENSKYLENGDTQKDSYDLSVGGELSECYEGVTPDHSNKSLFCIYTWECNDIFYSEFCKSSNNCFGCIGLKHGNYSIFNKQFTKSEYTENIEKIINHMKETGEWGEFFPMADSPFAYNESMAALPFPMTREDILNKGLRFEDNIQHTHGKTTIKDLPDDIHDTDENILDEVLECVDCLRNYKITKNEFIFYKKWNVPIPRKCFYCRLGDRFEKRNPSKLWHRKCMCGSAGSPQVTRSHHHGAGKCEVEFETSYAPDRPEIVYCEKCYQQEVY